MSTAAADAALDRALLDRRGQRLLKRHVDALKALPSFPRSIQRIHELVASEGVPDTAFERIAGLIESDPPLCARVLKMVNAAWYGANGPVSTVLDALVMLGFDVVRGVLLSASALSAFEAEGADLDGLWAHSFGCAVACSALARTLGLSRPAELTSAALMHDIGKIVLVSRLPALYSQVVSYALEHDQPVRVAEEALLGVTHDLVGRWLVARWRLPEAVAQPIAWHHTPSEAGRYAEGAAAVHIADLMIRGYGFGFPGDRVMPDADASAWRILGINRGQLDQAVARMHQDLQGAVRHMQQSGQG